jgi:hypothetical protein
MPIGMPNFRETVAIHVRHVIRQAFEPVVDFLKLITTPHFFHHQHHDEFDVEKNAGGIVHYQMF